MTSASLWFGEIAMAFGTLAFTYMSLRARTEDRHHYLVSIMICATATASYFAMAIGQTHLTLSDGHSVFVARYIDWAVTTPLLILGTAMLGMSVHHNKTTIYGAIMADVFMIATGLAGALSVDNSRWVWYTFSCIGFVAVLALLWGPMLKAAASQGHAKDYRLLTGVLTVLWLQYPIVWMLGDEGIRVLGSGPATLWYSLLDVTAKVVFGFLTLAAVARLSHAMKDGEAGVGSNGERRIATATV